MKKPWHIVLILFSVGVFFLLSAYVAICQSEEVSERIIILGKSKIIVPRHALVGTQVDRVIRDIAWKDSAFDERVDPNRIPEKSQLVPYMEGRLSGLLMDYAQVKVVGLGPVFAVKKGEEFFADDGNNDFVFPIDPSKTEYSTARFFDDGQKAFFPDTHGFNMIAGNAIRYKAKNDLFLVVACMDLPAKVDAALYIAKNKIHCFGPCDRFANLLLGYRDKYKDAATIIGTAPIRQAGDTAVIGDQAIEISSKELIITQYTGKGYPDQYSDTPSRYFEHLNKMYNLELNLKKEDAGAGEAFRVVKAAKASNAKVIGVRVWNDADAEAVASWLEIDKSHRAVLFHSAIYEPGYEMFFRFPEQTSFGDLSPIIK